MLTATRIRARPIAPAWTASTRAHKLASRRGLHLAFTKGVGPRALELGPNGVSTAMSICSLASTEARICPMSALRQLRGLEASQPLPQLRWPTTPRPIRPAKEWRPGLSVAKRPPSLSPAAVLFDVTEISAFSRQIKDIAPEDRRSLSLHQAFIAASYRSV